MSAPEEVLAAGLAQAGIPYQREVKLIPGRKHRVDFHITGHPLVVEVEGGTWTGGRHTSGSGFEKDCWKYNQLTLLGFQVLRFTSGMVMSGEALETIKQAIVWEA